MRVYPPSVTHRSVDHRVTSGSSVQSPSLCVMYSQMLFMVIKLTRNEFWHKTQPSHPTAWQRLVAADVAHCLPVTRSVSGSSSCLMASRLISLPWPSMTHPSRHSCGFISLHPHLSGETNTEIPWQIATPFWLLSFPTFL